MRKVLASFALVLGLVAGSTGVASATSYQTIAYRSGNATLCASSTTCPSTAIAAYSGDFILIYVGTLNNVGGATNTAVSDSAGNTYTKITGLNASSRDTAWWYTYSGSNAPSNVVTATYGSSQTAITVTVNQFTGVETSAPIDYYAQTLGGSGTPPSMTTQLANEWLICGGVGNVNSAFSAFTGWSNGKTLNNGVPVYGGTATKLIVSAGTTTGQCLQTGSASYGTNIFGAVAIKPAAIIDCPAGTTGTYPACTSTGGGGGGVISGTVACSNCSNVDINYLHQLSIKAAGLAIALAVAYFLIKPFFFKEPHVS